jgi:hypothetical protein
MSVQWLNKTWRISGILSMCHPSRVPHLCRSNAASHLHSETLLPRCQSVSQVSLRLLRKRDEFGKAIKLSPCTSYLSCFCPWSYLQHSLYQYFFQKIKCKPSCPSSTQSSVGWIMCIGLWGHSCVLLFLSSPRPLLFSVIFTYVGHYAENCPWMLDAPKKA